MSATNLRLLVSGLAVLVAACRPAPGPSAPPPVPVAAPVARAPLPPANPKLPPVPEVRGPVRINVAYPKPDQMLTVRDSNFIFGTVGSGDAGLRINGLLVPVWPNGSFMGWLPVPPDSAPRYELVASNGLDSAQLTLPIQLPPPPDTTRPDTIPLDTVVSVSADTVIPIAGNVYATLGAPASTVNDTDRVSIARPAPGNGQEYKWFLPPGTVVRLTGYKKASGDDFARIELDSTQEAWVLRSELQPVTDSVAPVRRIGTIRVEPSAEWIDIAIPTASPPSYLVEEGDRTISILLYGVTGAQVVSTMPEPADSYVASVVGTPEGSRARYEVNLTRAPYGYLVLWQNGALTLRVRRPPTIADASAPLRGLTITVDPGHPPVGATGPSGFYEADAVLPVGLKLRDLLVERGANVVMTRTTSDPVDLGLRPIISRRANAHAFVSIHLNAFPDGVNPFENNGTTTLHFWPHSFPLGRATQTVLVSELGLRDNGTRFQNIAVARGSWMPAILTEGAFIIMPDQEAALRTSEYQEAYARGLLRGLESYFASLAQKP